MNHVVIVHGWGADSSSNWFPWLRDELVQNGWKVDCPDFPNTQQPKLDEWMDHFEKTVVAGLVPADNKRPQGPRLHDLVLIGHSLGVPFILRWLERMSFPRRQESHEIHEPIGDNSTSIKAAILVAGFHQSLGNPATENFVDKPWNWNAILRQCRTFIVINSDNDPFIPKDIQDNLAKQLHVSPIIEHNGDHLNAPAGFLEYPRVRDLVLGL